MIKVKKEVIFFIILLLIMVFVGVNKLNKKSVFIGDNGKLQVTTSFYPLYFFAGQIAGDKADLYNITPASAEPHDYEPTTQDIVKITKSNLLILNGGGLEVWGDKIKETLKGHDIVIVTAGDGIANQQLDQNGRLIQDPHIWLSPPLAKKVVKTILEGLLRVDQKDKDYYYANANILLQKLDQLDQAYKQGLASCVQKDIVTSHTAFGYLAKTYGFSQISISGLSPDEEPSSKKMAEVSQFAKKHHIAYIFFESLVSPKLSMTIANEIGAKTLALDPIEGISENAIKQGRNYFTVMQNNLINLREALACQ